jgi:inorganic triphosphatase YgiF
MANEIELKLSLAPDDLGRFRRHPLLRSATARQTRTLVNIYYDTPTLALQRRGVALRLRKQGRAWLQTVKCAGISIGGLSSRPEWETPYAGHFDFSMIALPDLRDWLQKPRRMAAIIPLFETRFQRTTWRLEPMPGCQLLVMLDHGWIEAAGRREPICEVEIELAGEVCPAHVAALFDLAGQLGEHLPLVPTLASKAQRGYCLFLGEAPQPRRAAMPRLSVDDAPLAAFQRIARACLSDLQSNGEAVLRSEDAEFIHQMRVAARRLRAALQLFAACLPEGQVVRIEAGLRELMRCLGAVRDLDVLQGGILAPVREMTPDEPRLAALSVALAARWNKAQATAVAYLHSLEYAHLLLQVSVLLQEGSGGGGAESLSLQELAATRLVQLRKKLDELALQVGTHDPAALHRLRIAVKRLRYTLEFIPFELLPGKPVQHWMRELIRLQEDLGRLCDLARAGSLLVELAGEEARLREAVAWVGGWHARRAHKCLTRLPVRLQRLQRLRQFVLPEMA